MKDKPEVIESVNSETGNHDTDTTSSVIGELEMYGKNNNNQNG